MSKGALRRIGKAADLDELAHQRITIGVGAGRSETENDVARLHILLRQQVLAFGGTHREAREVIVAAVIHARHFRRFAADQGAARLLAAIGDAGDHLAGGGDIELSGGVIVEEEQRLGALHHQIVDRHGDEIDADAMVAAGLDGDAELGADAVIGGDEDRVLEAAGLEIEQAAEAAQRRISTFAARRLGQRLDRLDQGIAR